MTVETVAVLPDTLAKLIKKVAKDNGFSDYNLHAKSIDTEGGNYTGFIFTINIEEDGRELNLFAKASNTPEHARNILDSNDLYKREVFCYTELADAFDAIQSKHNIPEEQRYKFAKYYASNLNDLEETMVLEDISKKGYTMYDRLKSMDWEYAKLALDKLANFHALSFALEREEPDMFDMLVRSKKETMITDSKKKGAESSEQYFRNIVKMVLDAVDTEQIPMMEKFMRSFEDGFFERQYEPTEYSVLAHGDYRISNMMAKYEEGILADLIPLDYQLIYHGSPINDLLYLLVTGTDETFRRQHYEDFLRHYHDSLGRALASLSHDVDEVYPRSLFYAHLRDRLLYGLGVATFMMPMMLVTPGEQILVEDLAATGSAQGVVPTSKIYRERLRGLARDMVRWGALSL